MRQSRGAGVNMGSGTRRRERDRGTRSAKNTKAAGSPSAALNGEWDAAFDAQFEREAQELEQSGRTLTRVLFLVFLGIAVLMLVVAVLTGRSTQQKLAREQPALAQVTSMTERKDSQGNSFFYPVVAFDVPDGGRYNAQLSEGSWPPQHRVGDLVTVLYDTSNPLDARIQSGGGTAALWTWTLVTGILGVGFLLAAVLAWALGRKSG
jgi:hypothetical protein